MRGSHKGVADVLEVSAVPAESVPVVWSHHVEMIRKGLSKGQGDGTTEQEMLDEILNGYMQMWAVHSDDDVVAIVVVSIRDFTKTKKVMVNLIAGGELPLWTDDVQSVLLNLKDKIGADCIEASCRLGLAKYLSGKGWTKKAVIMELK